MQRGSKNQAFLNAGWDKIKKNALQKTFKCIEMQNKVAQGIAADNLGGKGAVLVQRCCANCPDLGEIHQDHSRKKPIDLQARICGWRKCQVSL